jgi:ribonuclease HI
MDAFDGFLCDAGYVPETTNNRMEMLAVISGLTTLHDCFGACDILVYSDSQYVVLGATDKTRKRNKNKDHWKWIDEAIDKHSLVEFVHIKGHQGQHFNEMADKLAGTARRKGMEDE